MLRNLKVLLAARPNGSVAHTDFSIVEEEVARPGAGEILLRNRYLSIDPYMRVRMNEGRSYAANLAIGDVMVGDTVAEVIQSLNPEFKVGDLATGRLGWQRFAISDGSNLRRIDPSLGPVSANLGILGMPGITAWYGTLKIGRPAAGETVVIGAASGAVGSAAGQIAKLHGCRVIGIAGGERKCRHVVDELGFDACIDHRQQDFAGALAKAVGAGIDIYFDTVGGAILDAVLPLCKPNARIPLCGMIADYDSIERYGIKNLYSAIANRVTLQGFIISDHAELWPAAVTDLAGWIASGAITYRETVAQGLDQAPQALIDLLRGGNVGKQIVKID
ncbi:NADP-dependent oxidoreductase [Pseudaminobacter salicylatoxidans]|uniref:NADP-dependent oxidoreductase n=1 Tax=Pseudaminobacter salicylatoxidans TaxID=93369 RepID=UPI000593D6FA|nr:NADP-dependent oxidoreductase [Pseudaminobacter salicylatoxidans]